MVSSWLETLSSRLHSRIDSRQFDNLHCYIFATCSLSQKSTDERVDSSLYVKQHLAMASMSPEYREVVGAEGEIIEHAGPDVSSLSGYKSHVTDRTPSALLPPLNRPHGFHNSSVGAKSFSTSRMAFMRRPKRQDPGAAKIGRGSNRDTEDQSCDDASTNNTEEFGITENARSASVSVLESGGSANSEGSIKRRVVRLERTIAEQTAWLRNKFDLEESDTLLDSCSGALVRKILLQGRVHITSSSICFYAKIFGNVTKEKWPFSSIRSVRKRRGGFVANSVKITFVNSEVAPVIIASLNRRDQLLAIIASRLSVLSPSGPDSTDRAVSVDEESEYNSDGLAALDSAVPDDRNRSDRSNCSTSHMSASDVPSRNSREGHHSLGSISDDGSHPMVSRETSKDGNPIIPQNFVWYHDGDPIDKVHGHEFERRVKQARCVFDVPAVIVFNALFMGDWFVSYLRECNHFDVEATDWYLDKKDGYRRRDLKYRRPLTYRIGPRETRVQDAQRYSFVKDGGVIIESESISLEAPFGDYFRVESYFELRPQNVGKECELTASIAVHFTKSTMLRSKIESGALAETKITLGTLVDLGKQRVAEVASTPEVRKYLHNLHRQNDSHNRSKARLKANPLPAAPQVNSLQTTDCCIPESDNRSHRSDGNVKYGRAAPVIDAENSSNTIIHMHDVTTAHALRILAVVSLLSVCILLFLVLLSFRRMKEEFKLLQVIVQGLEKSQSLHSTSCKSS